MRKIILTAAALVGLAGPAFAQNLTLPAGDYPQAQAPGWTATVDREPMALYTGRSAGVAGHVRHHRAVQR